MPRANSTDRSSLDEQIKILSRLSSTFTIDDFRTKQIQQSLKASKNIRLFITFASMFFLLLSISVIFAQIFYSIGFWETGEKFGNAYNILLSATWALSLGGLGAVANIFLHMMKLLPQETLRTNDEFEVRSRIILGCLFSMILNITLTAQQSAEFFSSMRGDTGNIKGGAILLLPFLAGYSIPLVLGLIEKTIRAIELTIGLDDRRSSALNNNNDKSRRIK